MVAKLTAIVYPVCSVIITLFGLFACIVMFVRQRRNNRKDSTEFFLTARRSVGWCFIGWSFFAAAMGSWTLFSPGSYGYYAGTLGLALYAFASGFPILVIAFMGSFIHKLVPNVLSFTDFVKRRFGPVVQVYVSLLMLFNMGVALTAEFTAVGDLFELVIGTVRWPIVVIIGIVSATYTAYGGLYVSIVTDQVQAACAISMILILTIWVAVTFKAPLPKPMPSYLAAPYVGYASIVTMPVSLMSSTVFSEAMWQRCWATVDKRQLRIGGLIGSVAVTICVFLLGFGGILAAWSGLFQPSGPDDFGNTILFTLLDTVNGGRHTIIIVIVSILSVTMSTSAVDSLQNAIVDNISGVYLKHAPLLVVRALVLALTVPPMIVSLKGYNIIQLFLVANLLTTTSTLPVLAGLIRHRLAYRLVTATSMLVGCAFGLTSLFWWTAIARNRSPVPQTYNQALHDVWVVNYDWPPFLIPLGMSVVGMLVGSALEHLVRAIIGRPIDPVDPLMDEQLPLGTTKGDDTSSSDELGYEKPLQSDYEPDLVPTKHEVTGA